MSTAPRMNRHLCNIDVRWGDLDMLGHVNNVAYMTYFETARVELIRTTGGLSRGDGIGAVVVQANISYRASATYPAALQVVSTISRFGTTSMDYHHVLRDRDGEQVYAEAVVTVVWVDMQANKPVPVPDFIKSWAQREPDRV